MNWRINSPGLTYDCGEGKVIYFDTASGDTHLISDFAAYLIRQIAHHSLDTDELVALIAPDIDNEDLAELDRATPRVLEELAALDILVQE